MAVSKDEVLLIVKEVLQQIAQQGLEQSGQQGGQQFSDQIAKEISQAVQAAKQAVQGTTQEKSNVVDSTTQNKQEEILGGEAIRGGVVSNYRLWNANEKYLFEKSQDYDRALKNYELKEKALEIAEREAKLRHQSKLDHFEAVQARNALLVEHLANTLSVDFRQASYHPISPNDQDKDAQGAKK